MFQYNDSSLPHLVAGYNVYTHHRSIMNRINPKLQGRARLFSGV